MNWYRKSSTNIHTVEVVGNPNAFDTRILFYNDYNAYPIWDALESYLDREKKGSSRNKQLNLFIGETVGEVVRLLLNKGLSIKSRQNQKGRDEEGIEKWTLALPNII